MGLLRQRAGPQTIPGRPLLTGRNAQEGGTHEPCHYPGTGKTHWAIALAIKAAEATYPVAFDSATAWITRLAEAHVHGRLTAELSTRIAPVAPRLTSTV
jgi:hypothetical protein